MVRASPSDKYSVCYNKIDMLNETEPVIVMSSEVGKLPPMT
jgi:hypothetical protein